MEIDGFTEVSAILRSGVYILADRGTVVYVGQSKSLYSRIYSHRLAWNKARNGKQSSAIRLPWMAEAVKAMKFDSVHIRKVDIPDLDKVERELIAKYRPKYNTQLKPKEPIQSISVVVNGFRLRVDAPSPLANFERRV